MNVYTPATLAERWTCSEQHVRNLIRRGELNASKLGSKLVRIYRAEVERFEREGGGARRVDGS